MAKFVIAAAMAVGFFIGVDGSSAQTYPTKPIRALVSSTAGGPLDLFTRVVTNKMSEELNQAFVVENRAGAGGNLAVIAAKQAPPDGYTILFAIDTTFTVNPNLFEQTPFDPDKDFVTISVLAKFAQMLAVPADLPVKSISDLKELSLKKDISYGSGGVASPSHLTFAYLQAVTGIRAIHVPYRVNTPALQALITGDIQASMVISTAILPLANEGKVRMLAYSDTSRSEVAPDIPTVAEQGFKDFQAVFSYVLLVQAGTPQKVIDILLSAATRAVNSPEVRDRLKVVGTVPIALSPTDSVAWLGASRQKWKDVITRMNIHAN